MSQNKPIRRIAIIGTGVIGAMSVATTCSPLARYSEVQLAPITPVPMIAMRRMGLVSVMSFLRCGCQISA